MMRTKVWFAVMVSPVLLTQVPVGEGADRPKWGSHGDRPEPNRVTVRAPLEATEFDGEALRAQFHDDVADAGLTVLDTVELARVSNVVTSASLIAIGSDFESGNSAIYYQRRDYLLVSTPDLGSIVAATVDLILAREPGDKFTLQYILRFADEDDRLQGAPVGLRGLTIEQRATITFKDIEALRLASPSDRDALKSGGVGSMVTSEVVSEFVTEVRLTNSQGETVTFAPGDMTIREALGQLSGGWRQPLGGGCDCIADCLVEFAPGIELDLLLCIVPLIIDVCIPTCVVCPWPCCPLCLGTVLALCSALDLFGDLILLSACLVTDCFLFPPDCPCGPGSGSCCNANGTAGCDDDACCRTVCVMDAFCCEIEWDEQCADEAADLCVGCQGLCPGSGDCCVANASPGCNDASCCETICGLDPFCCEIEWDSICADEACVLCDGATCNCPTECPGSGNCCSANGSTGCNDAFCCETVCEFDPYCCLFEWDDICADVADSLCDVC